MNLPEAEQKYRRYRHDLQRRDAQTDPGGSGQVQNDKIQLMAYDNISGVSVGSFVRNTKHRLKIPVGEFLRGRIIDATGKPIDSLGAFESSRHYYVDNTYINPLDRPPITDTLDFGVKAIDGLKTGGKGQRIGIFAGSCV